MLLDEAVSKGWPHQDDGMMAKQASGILKTDMAVGVCAWERAQELQQLFSLGFTFKTLDPRPIFKQLEAAPLPLRMSSLGWAFQGSGPGFAYPITTTACCLLATLSQTPVNSDSLRDTWDQRANGTSTCASGVCECVCE